MTRRRFVIGGVAIAFTATGRAMAGTSKKLRGVISEISNTAIKVQGADGQVRSFRLKGRVGMSIAHLKEHMQEREPVTVFYQEEGSDRVAIWITD